MNDRKRPDKSLRSSTFWNKKIFLSLIVGRLTIFVFHHFIERYVKRQIPEFLSNIQSSIIMIQKISFHFKSLQWEKMSLWIYRRETNSFNIFEFLIISISTDKSILFPLSHPLHDGKTWLKETSSWIVKVETLRFKTKTTCYVIFFYENL